MHLYENARFYIFTRRVKFTKVKFQRVSPAPPTAPDWVIKFTYNLIFK